MHIFNYYLTPQALLIISAVIIGIAFHILASNKRRKLALQQDATAAEKLGLHPTFSPARAPQWRNITSIVESGVVVAEGELHGLPSHLLSHFSTRKRHNISNPHRVHFTFTLPTPAPHILRIHPKIPLWTQARRPAEPQVQTGDDAFDQSSEVFCKQPARAQQLLDTTTRQTLIATLRELTSTQDSSIPHAIAAKTFGTIKINQTVLIYTQNCRATDHAIHQISTLAPPPRLSRHPQRQTLISSRDRQPTT
ncbi:hypothetical protein FEM03_21925 [Phragmitibacter flavus]|uniref:Uncharacterized protein n=1 Tax=Phragmitibacter flavus TaxID=2576071 RepID=A0A5R8K8G6_9BACT|nr:hypothetical protein [Phragmitibacter flavus]TLD68580.1 hypothetical protein FEM03_21925 [Phragmitibacter flavus]